MYDKVGDMPAGEEGPEPAGDVTALLQAWQSGEAGALDRLLPLIYQQLHRLAGSYFARESPGHTLQPTALLHEAWLKIADQRRVSWQNRAQFFAVAARLMRRVLVDHARERQALKRGGVERTISLEDVGEALAAAEVDVLDLDAALDELAHFDPLQSRLVELRYFTGLTIEETAAALEISPATVKREWSIARAWLFRRLAAGS